MSTAQWSITRLLEDFRREAELAAQHVSVLKRVEAKTAAAAEAAPHVGVDNEALDAARELLDLLNKGHYVDAEQAASRLCSVMTRALYSKLYAVSVEADTCPSPQGVKLAVSLLEASGPLAPVTRNLVTGRGAGKVSEIERRVEEVARNWRQIASLLTSIYASAVRLEKATGKPRTVFITLAAEAVAEASFSDALEALENVARHMSDAASAAYAASELLGEISRALQECEGGEARIYCRWLGQAAAEVAAAREELEKLAEDSSAEALRHRTAEARQHLRAARELCDMVSRLAEALGRKRPASLVEAVKLLSLTYSEHSLSEEEEEVLKRLVNDSIIDVASLDTEELIDAALRLCKRRLVRCTLRL